MPETEIRPGDVRLLRPVASPLASYLRPFRRDFTHLAHLIAEGLPTGSGIVLDAVASEADSLVEEATQAQMEVVLDSRVMELATPGGASNPRLAALPWAGISQTNPESFAEGMDSIARGVAEVALRQKASAVLAPTHLFLDPAATWLDVDVASVAAVRRALDVKGLSNTPIYYPLATSFRILRDRGDELVDKLRVGDVDAVWLRIQHFGTKSSGPVNLRRYIDFARRLHDLGIPVVGERTGTIGLALMAFGAVGGIESGITLGDRFDVQNLLRPRSGKGFVPEPRVYIAEIGSLVTRKEATALFSRRGMHYLVCQGRGCCRRGWKDMVADPRRHFIVTRAREVSGLGSLPVLSRSTQFLETWLRPASDRATRAMLVEPSFEDHRNRLDAWRATLSALLEGATTISSTSPAPTGRRVRQLESAPQPRQERR